MKSRIVSMKARALSTLALALGGAALLGACSSAPDTIRRPKRRERRLAPRRRR